MIEPVTEEKEVLEELEVVLIGSELHEKKLVMFI